MSSLCWHDWEIDPDRPLLPSIDLFNPIKGTVALSVCARKKGVETDGFMPSVGPVSGRVGVWWRMVRAGGVTKARTGPNWADAGFSRGRRRWDRGVTRRQGLSKTVPCTTPTQMFPFLKTPFCPVLSPSPLNLSVWLYISPPLFFSKCIVNKTVYKPWLVHYPRPPPVRLI